MGGGEGGRVGVELGWGGEGSGVVGWTGTERDGQGKSGGAGRGRVDGVGRVQWGGSGKLGSVK